MSLATHFLPLCSLFNLVLPSLWMCIESILEPFLLNIRAVVTSKGSPRTSNDRCGLPPLWPWSILLCKTSIGRVLGVTSVPLARSLYPVIISQQRHCETRPSIMLHTFSACSVIASFTGSCQSLGRSLIPTLPTKEQKRLKIFEVLIGEM
jgi:hypothetical protein